MTDDTRKNRQPKNLPFQMRLLGSSLLFLLQFLLIFISLYTLSAKYFWIYALLHLISAATVISILNRRGNAGYKIAWVILMLVFPIFGITVYFLWGGNRALPSRRKRMAECESHSFAGLLRDGRNLPALRRKNPLHARQAEYLMRESGTPLYRDTAVKFLPDGTVFFAHLLSELRQAKRYIFLEFFILAEGEMWREIETVLRQKSADGVEIRILFDDFGSSCRQRKKFLSRLTDAGIKVAVFNRIRPSADWFLNNRNHRKIVVIDGLVAFTGGINLGDEYINRLRRFGVWADCAVSLSGRAVECFCAMFCAMWEFTTHEQLNPSPYSASFPKADGFVLPYRDSPLNPQNPAEGIYLQMLNTAQSYVYIASPYLIIDDRMIATLRMAVKSGVDVRILTPHIPDKRYVHPVTQYNYLELLEAGVRIYEYTPGFLHAKYFVSDDSVATVGTVNMDSRSFRLHFECGVWFSDCPAVLSVRNHFSALLRESREISLAAWKKTPWFKRLGRAVLHLFSPFL